MANTITTLATYTESLRRRPDRCRPATTSGDDGSQEGRVCLETRSRAPPQHDGSLLGREPRQSMGTPSGHAGGPLGIDASVADPPVDAGRPNAPEPLDALTGGAATDA